MKGSSNKRKNCAFGVVESSAVVRQADTLERADTECSA